MYHLVEARASTSLPKMDVGQVHLTLAQVPYKFGSDRNKGLASASKDSWLGFPDPDVSHEPRL